MEWVRFWHTNLLSHCWEMSKAVADVMDSPHVAELQRAAPCHFPPKQTENSRILWHEQPEPQHRWIGVMMPKLTLPMERWSGHLKPWGLWFYRCPYLLCEIQIGSCVFIIWYHQRCDQCCSIDCAGSIHCRTDLLCRGDGRELWPKTKIHYVLRDCSNFWNFESRASERNRKTWSFSIFSIFRVKSEFSHFDADSWVCGDPRSQFFSFYQNCLYCHSPARIFREILTSTLPSITRRP